MKKWIGLLAGILCGILLYFGIDAVLLEQHSIGIIGGADGPTAIFVAGKVGTGSIVLATVFIAAVIAGIVWLMKKWK